MFKYNQHTRLSGAWCKWSGVEISKPFDGKCPSMCPDSEALEVKTHYHVNHNMPGYLPEADGFHTEDWSEALSALQDEIKEYQDLWSEECVSRHSNEVEFEDCMAGGAERCEWYELVTSAEADLVGLKEGSLSDGDEWGSIYSTPEGADVSVWLRKCSEADCVMTEDEN